jgi:putative tryptophan/tyrosine transport system substrate-binding protein
MFGHTQMDRRQFLGGVCGTAVLLPLTVHAQKLGRNPRIGYLSPARLPQLLQALHDGLHELGYVEGQNIAFDYRFAEGQAKTLDELAAQLVQLGPDVIVTVASGAAFAAKRATTTIPIVMATVGEPVGIGLVASLARPGGNITGVTLYGSDLARKRLELLKETIPAVRRVALLGNTTNPFTAFNWNEVQPAGPALGLELQLFTITGLGEFPATFAAIKQSGANALLVLSDALFNAARREIIKLASQYSLPTMFEAREFVEDGGLMAYGPNIAEMTRRSASLIVKIIKGANPGDLPIEQPTTFELSINVQAGRALGITIPATVLLRADKVIE